MNLIRLDLLAFLFERDKNIVYLKQNYQLNFDPPDNISITDYIQLFSETILSVIIENDLFLYTFNEWKDKHKLIELDDKWIEDRYIVLSMIKDKSNNLDEYDFEDLIYKMKIYGINCINEETHPNMVSLIQQKTGYNKDFIHFLSTTLF